MADAQAWQEGWQIGTEGAQNRIQHKRALANEEHEHYITDLFDQRKAILSNPTLSDTDKALNLQDVAAKLREAYHPDKHPDALQKFGHLITDNLRLTDPLVRGDKERARQWQQGGAKDEKTVQGWMAEAPLSPEKQAEIDAQAQASGQKIRDTAREKYLSDYFDKYSVDKSPEAKQRFMDQAMQMTPRGTFGKQTEFLLPDGGKVLAQRRPDGTWEGLDGSDVQIPTDAIVAPPTPKPGTSEFNERAAAYAKLHNVKFEDLTDQDFNFIDQQMKLAKLYGTTSVQNTLKLNMFNQLVPVTETNSRIPYVGQILPDPRGTPAGATGAPQTLPPTAGHPTGTSHSATGSSRGSLSTKVGAPVLQGPYPPYTKAKDDYATAIGLSTAAHAAAVADESVKAGLQRQIAGRLQNTLEKRFNLQAMDNLISHYGIANNFQTWLTRTETGALPDQVFNELVAMADNNVLEKKAALQAATPPPLNDSTNPDSGQIPDAAKAQLKEEIITTFGNGQKWTLTNGVPTQVK
jgi:hypothetical protein